MGTSQHHVPLEAGIRRGQRRTAIIAIATLAAVLLVIAVAQLSDGGGKPDAVQSAPVTEVAPAAVSLPSVRYDGGPEEGSRGAGTSSQPNPGRPDGGPEEGTRGPGH